MPALLGCSLYLPGQLTSSKAQILALIRHLIREPKSHSVKGANGYLHPGGKTQAQGQLRTRFRRLHKAQTVQSTHPAHSYLPSESTLKDKMGVTVNIFIIAY